MLPAMPIKVAIVGVNAMPTDVDVRNLLSERWNIRYIVLRGNNVRIVFDYLRM
jgi:hypothetical protein